MHVETVIALGAVAAVAWTLGRRDEPGRHERSTGPMRLGGYGWNAEGAADQPLGPEDDPAFMAGLGPPRPEPPFDL